MIHLAVCDGREEDRKWLKDAIDEFRSGNREIDAAFYENAEDLAADLEIRFPLDIILIEQSCLSKENLLETNLKTKNRLAEILILAGDKKRKAPPSPADVPPSAENRLQKNSGTSSPAPQPE